MGKPYNPIPALGAFGKDFLNKQNVIVSGTLSEMGVKGSNTISEAINTIDIGNAGLQDSLANVMTLGKNVYGELHKAATAEGAYIKKNMAAKRYRYAGANKKGIKYEQIALDAAVVGGIGAGIAGAGYVGSSLMDD